MKKVLILAYDFPPYSTVGAARPYSWYENLKYFNVHPIIVTRNWSIENNNVNDYITTSASQIVEIEETDFGTIIKTPYKSTITNKLMLKYGKEKFKLIRYLFTGYQEFIQHLIFKGPKRQIYQGAKEFLLLNKVDAIIATGEPFILFKYASALSKEFNTPWYADYRDDWIERHMRARKLKGLAKHFVSFERKMEQHYLKNVKGIISVSDFLVRQIKNRVKSEKFITIENGVNISLYEKRTNPYPEGTFNILYSGTLYDLPYLNDFKNAFLSFMQKNKDSSNVHLYFIGIESTQNQATKTVLELRALFPSNIHVENRKNTIDIAQYQSHANILLNLIAGDPSKGLIGAKSYNYAATKTPMLTIPNVKNANSPFFPNRDIQFVAISQLEIEKFIFEKYLIWEKGLENTTSITTEELYNISQKKKTSELVDFIFDKK